MNMKISLIVAMTSDRVIGKDGGLPWRLPADLKYFRDTTLGHVVVMGRKTYESVGKPLPGRTNIVVTRAPHFAAPGCHVVPSPTEALRVARRCLQEAAAAGTERGAAATRDCCLQATGDSAIQEIMILGGAEIYRAFLPRADRLYMTLVHADVAGDTYFPEFDWNDWREAKRSEHSADARNPYAYTFVVLERRSQAAPGA